MEKNHEKAFVEYYKVYANCPYPEWKAPALFQAGKCSEQLNRWSTAVKMYEALLKDFPDSEYAEKSRPLLEEARRRAE